MKTHGEKSYRMLGSVDVAAAFHVSVWVKTSQPNPQLIGRKM